MKRFIKIITALFVILSFFSLPGCSSLFRDKKLVYQNIILKRENRKLTGQVDNLTQQVDRLEKRIKLFQKTRYSLLFTGDILIDNELTGYLKKKGTSYTFKKIGDRFENYDLVFGNLETPIAQTGIPVRNKPYVFSLDPSLIGVFETIKLDAVSLANNHILDYGTEGMRETIKNLKSIGIRHCGAGENLKEARKPVAFQIGMTEVLIFSYCRRPPASFYATSSRPGTAPLNLKFIRDDIRRYRHSNSVIIISLHWGVEQTSEPQKYQRRLARSIINAGADAIIGHHPHWPQGIEVYRGRPIVYSLGNFVNGYFNKVEKDNIFTALHFRQTNLQKMEIFPVAGKNKKIRFQPYIMEGKEALRHLRYIQRLSAGMKSNIKIVKDRGIIFFNGTE